MYENLLIVGGAIFTFLVLVVYGLYRSDFQRNPKPLPFLDIGTGIGQIVLAIMLADMQTIYPIGMGVSVLMLGQGAGYVLKGLVQFAKSLEQDDETVEGLTRSKWVVM